MSVRRRGIVLNYITLGYNTAEAIASLLVGALTGSVALVGFGFDSVIELGASGAAQWRLRADGDVVRRERVERVTHRAIGYSFLLLAAYIAYESGRTLWRRERPEGTTAGAVILALSVVVMPILARAKRRVAHALHSRALASESMQTSVCGYLSAIALGGVLLNGLFGWWWADPVAALAMVPIIALEGVRGVRGQPSDDDCC